MTKVRACWLAAGWEKDLAHKVHNTKQGSTPFCDFSASVRRDNLLLKNTKYHLSPAQLRTQIQSNLSHEVQSTYNHFKNKNDSDNESGDENASPGTTTPGTAAAGTINAAAVAEAAAHKAEHQLENFVHVLIKLDDEVHEESASCQKEAEDAFHKLKCSGSNAGLSDSSQCAHSACAQQQSYSGSSTTISKANTMSANATTRGRPPKLTECEHRYLVAHSGCKKCRNFYVTSGHACKFPGQDGYMEHTMNAVNHARQCLGLAALPIPNDEPSNPVASIVLLMAPAPTTAPPPLPVAAVLGMTTYPVASIGQPTNEHSILFGNNGDLSRLRKQICPFQHPTSCMALRCQESNSHECIHFEALIDHGSHIVLIAQERASQLNL
jgi:hypothetical protein